MKTALTVMRHFAKPVLWDSFKNLLGWAFKTNKKEQPQKRNFDNVGWTWVKEKNGKEVNPFHIFSFSNGLGVIVMQHSIQTWDGMMCIAITDYKEELGYAPLSGIDLPKGVYTRAEGLDEEGVKNFCNVIRNLKRWK